MTRSELELKIDAIAGKADDEQWLSVEQIKALADFIEAEVERERREERYKTLLEAQDHWERANSKLNRVPLSNWLIREIEKLTQAENGKGGEK